MKNMIRILLCATGICAVHCTLAQTPTVQDCPGAIIICDSLFYQNNSFVGTGNYPNEIPTGGGCPGNCMLNGERNDVWYRINIQAEGYLGFELIPNNQSDDYDWVVYNLTEARCQDIFYQAASLQASCNWSATYNLTGPNGDNPQVCGAADDPPLNDLIPVLAGETYVINISNWSSTQYGYTLDFKCSTIPIHDTLSPKLLEIDTSLVQLGEDSLRISFSELVLCSSVAPSPFSLIGPDTTHQVNMVYGLACQAGRPYEKDFVLKFSPPIYQNGFYKLALNGNNVIQDACMNLAGEQAVLFAVGVFPRNKGIKAIKAGNLD